MPWKKTSPMHERKRFVEDVALGVFSMAELTRRFGVSRKTGYKWLRRHEEEGEGGLADRSKRPHFSPQQTDEGTWGRVLEIKRLHRDWGAKKLLKILRRKEPRRPWPACSTVSAFLKREGLVVAKRRRIWPGHAPKPQTPMTAPNEIWTVDYKGEFKTGDGIYCYPLTIVDGFSRYLLACQGQHSTATQPAMETFRRVFRVHGLPRIIRSDNGTPFATTALGRLSRLSVWWIKLGIIPELNEPAHPEQNGRHERMHKTLKASTTRPPRANLCAQQRAFNEFRREYNEDRPHEGLAMETPGSVYVPSTRALPTRLSPITYPAHLEQRLVSENGGIRWNAQWVCVTHVLAGEFIGLEPIDDGLWDVYFGPVKLGRLDERTLRISDLYGRSRRRKV